ncbi:hypothetical protein [Streptosporangium sp. NPDC051022]|uniref:hypothetical protein n=1 Tax=Streptosporangium sp. NPDC051022 TaxID=3155752 RepID=UPI0034253E0C
MKLPVCGHALTGLLDVVVAEPDRLSDGFRAGAGVGAEVADDRGAGVGHRFEIVHIGRTAEGQAVEVTITVTPAHYLVIENTFPLA